MSEPQGQGLVLTRRVGEQIMIGDDIEIVVREIADGQVKLAVIAPRRIEVHRYEVWKRRLLEGRRTRSGRRG